MKINALCILLFTFLAVNSFGVFAQVSGNSMENGERVANLSYSLKGNMAVYSFVPLTDFDEFKTKQRLDRINGLSGDNAEIVLKRNKILIRLNPSKTTGQNLERLLLSVVKIHGYDSFSINL